MKRKALYSVICTVLILLLAAALLVACNGDGVSETYTLSFRDGTEVIARVELQSGESLQASDIPEAPFHADENFVGWFIGIKEITAGYTPERSGVVVAKYEKIIKYTATFDMGGAPGDAPADVTVVENNSIQLPSVSWVGHAFLGWKLGEEPLHPADESYVMTGDVAFVAQWQEVDYTVAFSLGGAAGEDPAEQYGHYGDEIKLPDEPVWAEHTFLGWADAEGTTYGAGANFTIQDNILLTAQWQSDHEASEFVGVWMSANNYGYVVVTAAGADAFDVKGYVVGAYEAFEAQDVAYDGALGQFVVTIYKAANQQQAENVAFSISGGKLRAAGSSISPVTFDQQTDDTLAGYYLYHDAEDEVLEVVAGGLVVTNTAKLFGATQPVFAYIASDGADGYKLVYKHRTDSRAAELSGSQFEVTEDGNLHVHIADTCKLFVKGATAGESFDGPDGAKLYKYTVADGDVYAFRADATSDIVLATIEGTVAEGEKFTITYGEYDLEKYCKLVDGSIIYRSTAEFGEYSGTFGTLVLDGFGEGTLDGEDITYSYTDDEDEIIINGVLFTLSWNDTYSVAESNIVLGEYHKVGDDSVTLTYTYENEKARVILTGGSNPGTYDVQSSQGDYVSGGYLYNFYITVGGNRIEWHALTNETIKVVCKSGDSEYAGKYTLDHIIEVDIYPAQWEGLWIGEKNDVKVRISTKHVYVLRSGDEDWSEATISSKSNDTDYYLAYKGRRINIWGSSLTYLSISGFSSSKINLATFEEDWVGNYKTDDGKNVFIGLFELNYRNADSVLSTISDISQQDGVYTFSYEDESYHLWKDGDQLKLSKADGTEEQILTVALPDETKALYKKGSRDSIEFDGYGNFIYTNSGSSSSKTVYTGIYTVDADGNYIVSKYSGSDSTNGTWTISYNGNVITSPDGSEVYEKDAVIKLTQDSYYGTYKVDALNLILVVGKWSMAISTPAHNELEETYDIQVVDDETYSFTINGVTYTFSGYNYFTLNDIDISKFHLSAEFNTDEDGWYYYAYHNIVSFNLRSDNEIVAESVWFEGSEFRYSLTLKNGNTYIIKIEDGAPKQYYVWYNDEWMPLSNKAEPEYNYPHGVWQLEDGDTKITISGSVGNNVAYTFAVEGGSSATTSNTWKYAQNDSSSTNKKFTVNIDGIEYTVAGYGQILLITGDGGPLNGIYVFVEEVSPEFFTEEWFGQWTTIDYKHTIIISDAYTLKYKNIEDDEFHDVKVEQYLTYADTFNITIKGGVNADNKWVIKYTESAGMQFGESSSYASTQMYKDIFPHDWVGPWRADDGRYVNIYVDHVDYAASANSAWIAMSELSGSGNDFTLTFGDDEYRLYEEGGALKLSKDGSAHTLTKRAADKLAGRNYVDEDADWRIFEFDGYGNVEYNGYIGTYYIDVDGVTVNITFGNDSLDGAYTLSEHDHVLTNEDGDTYAEASIFEGLEGIYIGEGVIIVLGKYTVIIATNEHTNSEEVVEIVNQNGEDKEYHFNAFGTPYVLTNASGSLTLDSTALTKIPSSLYANDNAYAVGFNGTAITFNKAPVDAYTVSFADDKPTISFNVSDVAYTITKEDDVYKISANGASYDMSTTPVAPATIFGTWTKDDITWTIDLVDSKLTLNVSGGSKAGDYVISQSEQYTYVKRTVSIDVSYEICIDKQTLTVTGKGEYAGTYSKTAPTTPNVFESNLHGVWDFTMKSGIKYVVIITQQHAWLRAKADKGGAFEDFYDVSNWGSSYSDVYLYWMTFDEYVEFYGGSYGYLTTGGNIVKTNANPVTGCNATSPEEYLEWEKQN